MSNTTTTLAPAPLALYTTLLQVQRELNDACDLAMTQAVQARIPECGDFGRIAQTLDWCRNQLPDVLQSLKGLADAQAAQQQAAQDAVLAQSRDSAAAQAAYEAFDFGQPVVDDSGWEHSSGDSLWARTVFLESPFNDVDSRAHAVKRLQQIAMGELFDMAALDFVLQMPDLSADESALVQRWRTGSQQGTDHVGLQDLALKLQACTDWQSAPSVRVRFSVEVAHGVASNAQVSGG